MKKLLIISLLALLMPIGAWAQKSINGHEYVDLGLPSGVLWATCNVGASSPSDYGDYYAWGETETKLSYTEDNCETSGKEIDDINGTNRDVAHVKWGSTWRLPTKTECQELIDNCAWAWITRGGIDGYKVTGPSGNQIFLPVTGCYAGSSSYYVGTVGSYWTATPNKNNAIGAYDLFFRYSYHEVDWGDRCCGRSVRPVSCGITMSQAMNQTPIDNFFETELKGNNGTTNGHDYVDLGLSVKWATCNVGASSPSDYGNYYAWGEISTKSTYTSDNSKTLNNGSYNYDIGANNLTDAASANWGNTWRMPTKAEAEELVSKCTWTLAFLGGKAGYKVTGPNGNSIFVAASGARSGGSLFNAGESVCFWTSSPVENMSAPAYHLSSNDSRCGVYWSDRKVGYPVRPVTK